MKSWLAVLSLAALGGCAVVPVGAPNYGTRMPQGSYDPYEWHVVSAEPVQGQRDSRVLYTTEPVYGYQQVYAPAPVYVPQPYYYTPPVTIGLDFMFGGRYGGRHGGGWGGGRGRGGPRGHR